MDSTILADAGRLWEHHHIGRNEYGYYCNESDNGSGTPVWKPDLILGFGSHDGRVAERCAELYLAGAAGVILFTGGLGRITGSLQQEPEAAIFRRAAERAGVPAAAILTEELASNTGENIRFSRSLVERIWADKESRLTAFPSARSVIFENSSDQATDSVITETSKVDQATDPVVSETGRADWALDPAVSETYKADRVPDQVVSESGKADRATDPVVSEPGKAYQVPDSAVSKAGNPNRNTNDAITGIGGSGRRTEKRRPFRILAVDKPARERRTLAALRKQWPGPEFRITSPLCSFAECLAYYEQGAGGTGLTVTRFINMMIGDLIKMEEYAEKGYQIPQAIPDEVRQAGRRLQEKGFSAE